MTQSETIHDLILSPDLPDEELTLRMSEYITLFREQKLTVNDLRHVVEHPNIPAEILSELINNISMFDQYHSHMTALLANPRIPEDQLIQLVQESGAFRGVGYFALGFSRWRLALQAGQTSTPKAGTLGVLANPSIPSEVLLAIAKNTPDLQALIHIAQNPLATTTTKILYELLRPYSINNHKICKVILSHPNTSEQILRHGLQLPPEIWEDAL